MKIKVGNVSFAPAKKNHKPDSFLQQLWNQRPAWYRYLKKEPTVVLPQHCLHRSFEGWSPRCRRLYSAFSSHSWLKRTYFYGEYKKKTLCICCSDTADLEMILLFTRSFNWHWRNEWSRPYPSNSEVVILLKTWHKYIIKSLGLVFSVFNSS